jgi:hypothetical protein
VRLVSIKAQLMEPKISRNPSADFAPMKNESILFHPKTNQFCMLNASATFIWSQLEHPRTVSELAGMVCNHFDGVSITEAVRDVKQTIDQLISLDCLTSQV